MKPKIVELIRPRLTTWTAGWLAGLLLICCALSTEAATIFPSRVGSVGGGAALNEPSVTHGVSDANGTLFVWSTDDQAIDQSLSLNVSSNTPGVIRLAGAAVFNPFVDVGIEGVSTNRWQGTGGGTISADAIENIVGVAVTDGFGLDPAVSGFDPLHDPAVGAWLFARVDYDIIALGSTQIQLSVGPVDVVHDGGSVAGAFTFGSVTVEVIPEPHASLIWALLGGGVLLLRRRPTVLST